MNFENYFTQPGAYVLVDGQFGSTGKGLFAAYIAQYFRDRIGIVTTNAGPNSGHTAYWDEANWGPFDEPQSTTHQSSMVRVMTQQIPVASVFLEKMGRKPITYINAGAIVDSQILNDELLKFNLVDAARDSRLVVHPCAALIAPEHREQDQTTLSRIASTGKGIGPAMADKLMRQHGVYPTAAATFHQFTPPGREWSDFWNWGEDVVFVETAQGFSLGLNEARFYPQVTSRECTVGQALADARIPAKRLRKTIACLRTYPIRVGNTDNSSGGCYPDQQEIEWKTLGVEPELTTVTKRKRRIFTWSWVQYREMLVTNEPDTLFVNFVNYLGADELKPFMSKVLTEYHAALGRAPDAVFIGHGPLCTDIERYF